MVDSFWIGLMLLFKNTGREVIRSITFAYRNEALQNNITFIHCSGNVMNATTTLQIARFKGSLMRMKAFIGKEGGEY